MDTKKRSAIKNYQFVNKNGISCNLGFGAYGSVQLGKSLLTGQTVAIKKIGRKIGLAEVEIHMKLNHPNIIKMIDYHFDEKQECTYLVLEYAQNGTLFDYIREYGLKDKRMIRGIFMSACDAINYMHSMNIMHRDIKPENILLDRKNSVKVCDFGFAAHCEPRMTICGTVEYMAPEMIIRKPYNHKIDIWGLGILLFEMIEGKAPFEGQSQDEVLEKMKKPLYFSKKFSTQEIELVHKILKVDPNERPEIRDIMKSQCLKSSYRGSEDSAKRSGDETITTNDDKRSTFDEEKKIRIVEVIDLQAEKDKKEKSKVEKKCTDGIKIIRIRDLEEPDESPNKWKTQRIQRTQKPEKVSWSGSSQLIGKDSKISLKKIRKI